jgi:cell wall-associated NlpC family hydrolase
MIEKQISKIKIALLCSMTLALHAEKIIVPKKMVVNIAIANLRYEPKAHNPKVKLPTSDLTNPLQITQLLLGEHVIAREQYKDEQNQTWYHVNTMQQEFCPAYIGWIGYPGWIQANDLIEVENFTTNNIVTKSKLTDIFDEHNQKIMTVSIGTRLQAIEKNEERYKIVLPNDQIAFIDAKNIYKITQTVQESEQELRASIAQKAQEFIGDWYSWGGRSAQNDNSIISSVDCSALINLSFLAHGLQIPRMSHEQFLRSKKIQTCNDLQPGDFIYFASITKQSLRMDHVMMFLGDDQILETTFEDAHKARIVSFHERMGKPCQTIEYGDVIEWHNEQFHVYFGSLLSSDENIQTLRNHALQNNYFYLT